MLLDLRLPLIFGERNILFRKAALGFYIEGTLLEIHTTRRLRVMALERGNTIAIKIEEM